MNLVCIARVTSLLAMCLVVAGCGGPTRLPVAKVSGTVYLDDKAHGPARLTLTPVSAGTKDLRSTVSGEVAADGKYTLTTYDTGDGAPPGKYNASLMAPVADAGSTDPAEMMKVMGAGVTPPVDVEIPAAGNEKLDLKFTKAANPAANPNSLLPPP